MSRQLFAALLLLLGFGGCGKGGPPTEPQVLDRRIPAPVRIPTSDAWRTVPNFRIHADSIEVETLSMPLGSRVSNAVDLRRLLVSLPRTDWPYGRQALCQFPSIIPIGEDRVPDTTRWLFDVLRDLDITCTGVA
jgi:hypothetical protein